jgi:hypothetical protein
MTDRTIVESTDGHAYLVELDYDTVVTFLDADTDELAGTFNTSELATVDGALALNLGAGRYLDEVATANVKQFCRI